MIKPKSFAADVLTLSSVPIFTQIVGLLLTPLVTRLYPPEAFGLANVLGSVVMLFAVFSTMGYHGAIILPKSDVLASSVLIVCFISILFITLISFFIVTVGAGVISAKLNTTELANYLWLTPVFVFFHGTYQTLRSWHARINRFGNIAISNISEIILKKAYQIPAGFLGYGTGGNLITGNLISAVAKNVILTRNIDLKYLRRTEKVIFSDLISAAKRYNKFPKISVWSELFSRIPAIISSFLIIKYFGQDILGFYGLSMMVLALPATLISSSITEAFSPRAAMAKHDGKHSELLGKVFNRIIILMIFPFLILGLFGDSLFLIVFGIKWMQSGVIAQIMALYIFLSTIFSPVFSFVNIMELQELELIRSIANSIIAFVSLLAGAHFNSFYLGFMLLMLLQSVSVVILGGYMMRFIKFPFWSKLKAIYAFILVSLIMCFILFSIENLFNVTNIIFIGIIVVLTITYYIIVLYQDHEMLLGITSYFSMIYKKK